MHELSIAGAIVAVALEHAGDRRVTRIEVKIGHLRQVVPSALEFAFELATQGTVAEGAELAIEHVPAAGRCRACGVESRLEDFPLRCAACGSLDVVVTEGEELLVDALEVDNAVAMKEG
jgi:hydrogenase nickel incorporation protein HypA/HybF